MDTHSALELVCATAGLLWLTLTLVVLVGRAGHDLRVARRDATTIHPRRARTLARRARRHRTERGRWRRANALVELGRAGGGHADRPLLLSALTDDDADVRSAAVRALGAVGETEPWARALLVEALVDERAPRSRVAAQLEGLTAAAELLPPLLQHEQGAVRYWAAMLLAGQPETAAPALVALVDDVDPSVRRAAIEALAERGESDAVEPILDRLDDEVMFVRAHACRAAGRLGGPGVAPRLLPLLGDPAWWVRAAAKDTLCSFGRAVAPLLFEALDSPDRFARNGAAEVLQDLGIVDELLRTAPDSPLLHRIFRAGGRGLVDAARLRADRETGAPLEPATDSQAAA